MEAGNNGAASNKKEPNTQKRGNDGGKKQGDAKKGRPFNFTPLTDTLENIFFATKDDVNYPTPPKMRVGNKMEKSGRFCRFHNQPGHDTNECRQLKEVIEQLLKENKLQQYVKRSRNAPALSTQGQQVPTHRPGSSEKAVEQESERPVINIITGGPHPAGKNWGEMERYARALRHVPAEENVFVLENDAPLKQQKTSTDDIVFSARDSWVSRLLP